MTSKAINELSDELLKGGKLSDELLDFFREVDCMNSIGMMSWVSSTCKGALDNIESGKEVYYKGNVLNREGFLGILNENLSDFLMKRILG